MKFVLCFLFIFFFRNKNFESAVTDSFKAPSGSIKQLQSCRTFENLFDQKVERMETRFQLFKLLEKNSDLGLCYLVVNPYLSPDCVEKLKNFIIDKDFKLKLDGNELIRMGVPKGKEIFNAKNYLMEHCINCPDLNRRNTLEFQQELAKTYLAK